MNGENCIVLSALALYYKPFAKEMEVISEGDGKDQFLDES
jgi:hypothetical protein